MRNETFGRTSTHIRAHTHTHTHTYDPKKKKKKNIYLLPLLNYYTEYRMIINTVFRLYVRKFRNQNVSKRSVAISLTLHSVRTYNQINVT
ncbi:hypothetical protein PUN28_015177 [Cardiocondyla obscurior]|uniref:Uncharacterized protein n=1 Tax=Cardiocondyla obscurior TaxID=286306 RepID=A0AAW2F189_9HYME